MDRKFAAAQELGVPDNDEVLRTILFIMERTFRFAGAIPLVMFQRAV
jgi:hypothetical protein